MKYHLSHTHSHSHSPLLTLFSTGGSLVLCILELVLCKLKVHENHCRPCERADYDSSGLGWSLRFCISSKLSGMAMLRGSCASHTTEAVSHIRTHHILKHWALTRITVPSPATSHTKEYPRKGVSSLSFPGTATQTGREATPPLNPWTSLHTDGAWACLLRQLYCCKTFPQHPHLWDNFLICTTGPNTTRWGLHRVVSRVK